MLSWPAWLTHRRLPLGVALLCVVLCLPAVQAGVWADDYVHLARMNGVLPSENGPLLDMFRFMPGTVAGNAALHEHGFLPWWSLPDVRAAFLRPLAAATHLLDYALWPDRPALAHVHSLLWAGGLVSLVALFYRRVMGLGIAAGLAALLFAVEDAHAAPMAWVANRNALMAGAFGVAAVMAHIRWREGRAAPVWAVSLLGLALLCGESGLGAVAYIAAWEFTLAPRPRRGLHVTPALVLVVIWRLIYDAYGYGAYGSGLYVDPGRSPLGFAQALVERGPLLLLSQWGQVPVDGWMLVPRLAQQAMSVAGLSALAGLLWLFLPIVRRDRVARFWALGMAFAIVPLCAAFPMDRLLLFPGIGAFGLLARVCTLTPEEARSPRWSAAIGPTRMRVLRGLLALHLILAPALLPARIVGTGWLFGLFDAVAAQAPMDAAVPDQTFVFLNGFDLLTFYVPVIRMHNDQPAPRRVALLSSFASDVTVTRVGERRLEIRPREGFLAHPVESLMRAPGHPFAVGDQHIAPDFTVTVTDVTDDGRPAVARFDFAQPLSHDGYRWLAWRDGRLIEVGVLAVGGEVRLPATVPSPW